MIIWEITGLAHAHWVEQSIFMLAIPCILVATVLPVATWTHVLHTVTFYWSYFGIMFSMNMGTLGDQHYFLTRIVINSIFKCLQFLLRFLFFMIFFHFILWTAVVLWIVGHSSFSWRTFIQFWLNEVLKKKTVY